MASDCIRVTGRLLVEFFPTVQGSLFALGTTAVNAVSLATVKRNVREITEEMPLIQQQMKAQAHMWESLSRTLFWWSTHTLLS